MEKFLILNMVIVSLMIGGVSYNCAKECIELHTQTFDTCTEYVQNNENYEDLNSKEAYAMKESNKNYNPYRELMISLNKEY